MSEETYLSPEDMEALREAFRAQTTELLEEFGQRVLALESSEPPLGNLKAIQRIVHTIKGDSMALELDQLADLSHRLEDLLDDFLNNDRAIEQGQIDLLLKCGDFLVELLLACFDETAKTLDSKPLIAEIEEARQQSDSASQEAAPQTFELTVHFARDCAMHSAGAFLVTKQLLKLAQLVSVEPDPDTSAIEASRSFRLVVRSSQKPAALKKAARIPGIASRVGIKSRGPAARSPVTATAADTHPRTEPAREHNNVSKEAPREEPAAGARPRGSEQLRVEVEKIDRVMNLVGELVIGRSMVSQVLSELSEVDQPFVEQLTHANHFLERTLKELQTAALKIRMVPVDRVFRRFPRMVRELARECGKEVKLEIQGAATELDKGIADAIGEPLLHLIRNAIDHGLETPDERRTIGKPGQGLLLLNAFYEGNQVHIAVEDDGRGIDLERVADRARELGLWESEELARLAPQELLNAIYHPGFSTRQSVSAVSGRGVGMDVVRQAIENLKGTIELETHPSDGTRFLLRLPLTLAILPAVLVEAAQKIFAVPLAGLFEIVRLSDEERQSILGQHVLDFRNQVLPLVYLNRALGLTEETGSPGSFVLVVGEAQRRLGLVVDKVVGEHDLVVKPIEDPLTQSPGISGASILGNGDVVLILNISGLSESRASRPELVRTDDSRPGRPQGTAS